jgi:CO/xanthine dehydrogenase Mo-binding subunit
VSRDSGMRSGDRGAPPDVRKDAVEKVTGAAKYISDLSVPGMAQGKVLRSPIPHGRIVRVDASRALALDGVVAVLTGDDVRGLPEPCWGLYFRDRPLIALDKVRYAGEPVAAVAAEDEYTAEEALELIDVDYDPLPFVADPDAALAADAPLVHERFDPLEDFYFKGKASPVPGTNIFQKFVYEHGDVEAAQAAADRVFDDTFTFPMVYHYALEPHTAIASFDGDGLTVWSCGQTPTAVQKVLARIFGLPQARVRVIVPYVGGGFGGKASVKIDPLVAALAWKARRPVRVRFSAQESMLTCRRLAARCHLRTAVKADGTILAKTVRIVMDGGAYADTGPAVAIKAANRSIGPYRVPNLRLESLGVYTNTVPGAAFRSIGGPQAVWAAESHMDAIATGLGLDPVELRYRNLARKGEPIRPDLRPLDVDLGEALGIVTEVLARPDPAGGSPPAARGIALAASDPGILPLSSATVRLKVDGSVLVLASSVELGQGVRTVLADVAAGVLGVPATAVTVATPDTLTTPFDWGTGASRSTVVVGLAVEQAAVDVVRQVSDLAAEVLGMERGAIRVAAGHVTDGRTSWTVRDLLQRAFGVDTGEIIGHALLHPRSLGGRLAQAPAFWETAAGGCTLAVDPDTGHVRVTRYVSVAEVGRVLNRKAAEGQDEGAAVQGLGHALYEEFVYQDGQPINATLMDYHVPTIDETPDEFVTVLLESGDGPGPGGARGMGEGGILPVAPAIANAIARAYGVRIRALPLTPERVWRALRERSEAR